MATAESGYRAELGEFILKDELKYPTPFQVGWVSIIVGIGFATLFYFTSTNEPDLAAFFGLIPGIAGVVCAVQMYQRGLGGNQNLSLFENAIVLENKGETTTLMLKELDKFQLAQGPLDRTEVYLGDGAVLSFEAGPESAERKIIYSTTTDRPFVKPLLEVVSEEMCMKMAAVMSKQGRVEWADDVLISKEGIFAPVETMISSNQEFISWSNITEFDIDDGKLEIELANETWTVVSLDTNAVNFYPGYLLFRQLFELHRGALIPTLA